MACKDANQTKVIPITTLPPEPAQADKQAPSAPLRLLFGVDSSRNSAAVLQNNLSLFDWVSRNKLYPNFWGRNINGHDPLTSAEISFLHSKGCKIAPVFLSSDPGESYEQGMLLAKKAALAAFTLHIPENTALFWEAASSTSAEFFKGYAQGLLTEGYTPGFKADTDAHNSFDREFSRGAQTEPELFRRCLLWAISPSLKEYDRVTTTHRLHPDLWSPFAPSGSKRRDIALWQYGRNCHPIEDDAGVETVFHLNLIRDERIILDKMF